VEEKAWLGLILSLTLFNKEEQSWTGIESVGEVDTKKQNMRSYSDKVRQWRNIPLHVTGDKSSMLVMG
jgi:hypothetical protein